MHGRSLGHDVKSMKGYFCNFKCAGFDGIYVPMQAELDRFVNALIAIREEVREIEEGKADKCVILPLSFVLHPLPPHACGN